MTFAMWLARQAKSNALDLKQAYEEYKVACADCNMLYEMVDGLSTH